MYREYGQVVAVTNRSLTERPFLEQIRRVCEMHPDALLLREKDLSEKEYEELAKEVMAICAEYKVPCILHTFWRVAEKLKCDTVHLPLPILRQFVLEKQNQKDIFMRRTAKKDCSHGDLIFYVRSVLQSIFRCMPSVGLNLMRLSG